MKFNRQRFRLSFIVALIVRVKIHYLNRERNGFWNYHFN